MRITNIKYERTIPREEYGGREGLTLSAHINEGESVDMAINALATIVYSRLGEAVPDRVNVNLIKATIERPAKVDEAKAKIEARKEAPKKEEVKKVVKKVVKKAEVKAEVKKEPIKEEVKKVEITEPVKEEVKEVVGIAYDRTNVSHKKELKRLLDELFPQWVKDADAKKVAKDASVALEGKTLLLGSGKISSVFIKALKEKLGV